MHVRIIDGNSLGYALFFIGKRAGKVELAQHAIRGFLEHVRSRLRYQSDIVNVIVWDGHAQWRQDLQPGYKGERVRTTEQITALNAFTAQQPIIGEALKLFPVIQLCHQGAESRDVAYGLSRQLVSQGHLVDLVTSNVDWLGLVANRIRWANVKKITEVTDISNFAMRTGVRSPKDYLEVKALTGDADDGILGLQGLSSSKARELLARYRDLDTLLSAAQNFLMFSGEPKAFHPLSEDDVQERIRDNLTLVDCAAGPTLYGEDIEVLAGELDAMELCDLFHRQELDDYLSGWTSWEKVLVNSLRPGDVQAVRRAVGNIASSWLQGDSATLR